MGPEFWAERAARNIHDLSPSEEGVLIHSAQFRDRVKRAYASLYGEDAELIIETDGERSLTISWFRPTKVLYQQPAVISEPLREVVVAVDVSLVQAVSAGRLRLFDMTPRQFEEFVAELLEEHGYRVELTKQTPDHGYDIFACTQNALGLLAPLIVQCKRYRIDRTVGVSLVRELHAVQTTMNIPHAMLATTARFSREAQRFAAERVRWGFMKLADYETLTSWLSKVQR